MIITKFNEYLEKHSKKTYLVLCIVIGAIFVFTIGSGDNGCTGQERLTSLGSMYGKNLAVDDVMRKVSQMRLFAALNGQRLPRVSDFELVNMALQKVRLVHEAENTGLGEVTDEDLAKAVAELPYWKIADKDRTGNPLDSDVVGFSQARFKTFIQNVVKEQYRLTGEDFDEMIKDNIKAERVIEKATKDVKADDQVVRTIAADSTLMVAEFPFATEKASEPAADELATFLKDRVGELTDKDKMTNFFVIAYRDFDELFRDKKASANFRPADEVLKAEFDKEAATTYKDKKFDDVKDAIAKKLAQPKAAEWLKARIAAFQAEIAKPVPEKSNRMAQFRAAASANSLRIRELNGYPESESFIQGFDGEQKALVAAVKALQKLNEPSAVITLEGEEAGSNNGSAIAIKVDNPRKADNMKKAAANILRGEKALVLFKETIVKNYEPKLATCKSIDDFVDVELKDARYDGYADLKGYADFVEKYSYLNDAVLPFLKEEGGAEAKPEGEAKEAAPAAPARVVFDMPQKDDARLLRWYKRLKAAEVAENNAKASLEQIRKAIQEGKTPEQADKRFRAVKNPVNWFTALESSMNMRYQMMYRSQGNLNPSMLRNAEYYGLSMAGMRMGVSVRNLPAFIAELDKAGDKVLLDKPVMGSNSCFLVYQTSRALPENEEGKKHVEEASGMLEQQKKSEAVKALMDRLEQESNTQFVPEFMPREGNAN